MTIAFVAAAVMAAACSKSDPSGATQCVSKCDGVSAGQPDGCGGTCGQPVERNACAACGPNEICLDDKCVCQPRCDGTFGEGDGCGGSCACPAGQVRNTAGRCVAKAECTATCKSESFECGDVCGASCGDCTGGKACAHGKCICVPKCDGSRCDDGCGGTCACAAGTVCATDGRCVAKAECRESCAGASRTCGSICGESCGACQPGETCSRGKCAPQVTCLDCDLRMRVIGGDRSSVRIAIDYEPSDGEARPRIADFRIRGSKPFGVVAITPGPALAASKKELSTPPGAREPWRVRPDGTLQVLVQSTDAAVDLAPGRIAILEVTTAGPVEDLQLWLVRREQVFAPPAADGVLQASTYDAPLSVKR